MLWDAALTCDNPALVAILPMIGMLRFLGLAIICDEFSCHFRNYGGKVRRRRRRRRSSIHGCGRFCAELFAAMVSTFVAPPSASDTGFGTIVGSAVFNVLFVIGACAVFSRECWNFRGGPWLATQHTIQSGYVLAVFFGLSSSDPVNAPASMEWWECMILLLLYIGYVVMMKYNRWIHFP